MKSPVKLLSSTALAAAAMVMAVPAASAGNHTSLEKRVKALEKAGGGQTVTRSKKTMKLVVSGHINRLIQFVDNGTTSGFEHTTSIESRSRVRWVGTGKINDDVSVQTYIELGNRSSSSTAQDLTTNGDNNGNANQDPLDERHIDMIITSKSLGKLWVGQGRTGSESTSENDLSGTGLLSLNADEFLVAAGEDFQRNGAAIGRSIGQVQNNLDGHGRRDRIRYDTPKFAGFQITTSHENADGWSTALRYGGSFGGVKVKAGIGYSDDTTRNGRDTLNGSASILLPFGLSFTVAAGRVDSDRAAGTDVRDNAEMRYAKVGYRFKGLEIGETRLFVSYGEFEDIGGVGEESETFAFGVIQILEPLGIELQAGYANFALEQPGLADPDDIDVVTIGARVKF
jgi:hypothetical protein